MASHYLNEKNEAYRFVTSTVIKSKNLPSILVISFESMPNCVIYAISLNKTY